MSNSFYNTEHYSSESILPFPDYASRREIKAMKFKPKPGTCQMEYVHPEYPNVKYLIFCDDTESTQEAEVADDLFCFIDGNAESDALINSKLEP